MRSSPSESFPSISNMHLLLGYVADLELEVDRLRRQGQFVQQEVRSTLKQLLQLCAGQSKEGNTASPLDEVGRLATHLAGVLRDLQESPGYHPAHDQVVAIAIRPLVEQVFRSQQRLVGAPEVVLRLELETDYVEWFPARLRHILDNLLSNSLRFRDSEKGESWVRVGLSSSPEGHQFRVSDNGLGLPADQPGQMFELFYRAAPTRAAGLGVGLAVVKVLIEQSGGKLAVDSGEGQGTTITLTLPPYELQDFLC